MDYNISICRDCSRESCCSYPCEAYANQLLEYEKYNQPIIKFSKGNNSYKSTILSENEGDSCNMNKIDIEDILTCSIDSPEFLQCCNGLRMISTIIDWKSLLSIMVEKNEEFCESEGLCEICRSELEEKEESRGEHFGTECCERIVVCPKCG